MEPSQAGSRPYEPFDSAYSPRRKRRAGACSLRARVNFFTVRSPAASKTLHPHTPPAVSSLSPPQSSMHSPTMMLMKTPPRPLPVALLRPSPHPSGVPGPSVPVRTEQRPLPSMLHPYHWLWHRRQLRRAPRKSPTSICLPRQSLTTLTSPPPSPFHPPLLSRRSVSD